MTTGQSIHKRPRQSLDDYEYRHEPYSVEQMIKEAGRRVAKDFLGGRSRTAVIPT